MVIPARTKDPCHADNHWTGTFSPGWYYEPGLKGPLVPAAKNVETKAKLEHRSKVCSLVVEASAEELKSWDADFVKVDLNTLYHLTMVRRLQHSNPARLLPLLAYFTTSFDSRTYIYIQHDTRSMK